MSDTQKIKAKLDIVDFINDYVKLKAAGVNHKGLCPFHNEKSPSFMANRDRQSWYCFGCNKGGDIFNFVQEIEGMEFVEALKFLADKAGVELTMQRSKVDTSQKNRLKDIMVEAARFYHNVLRKIPAAKPALDYLHNRGLTDDTIDNWQIGYIPDQWDLLTKYLLKKGFSVDDLVAAGITIKRDNANPKTYQGFYDRFRGRIMFPIRDLHGYVVGFTGRVLVETEKSGGKYVNTPQTMLFDKSRLLFGLDKSKQTMKQDDLAVVVEGQMDVIATYQAGMTNVVASSGTALTEEQIKLIKRYTDNIAMAFDADDAGQRAAKRGIDIAIEQGMNVRVIQIPDGKGKDPDECVKENPDVWFDAVKNAQDVMHWYLEKAQKGRDLSQPKDKQAAANEVLPEIARIPYAVEKDHWLKQLAGLLGVGVPILREDLARIEKKSKQGHASKEEVTVASATPVKKGREELQKEQFLELALLFPDEEAMRQHVTEAATAFSSGYLSGLYEMLKMAYNQGGSLDMASFTEEAVSKGYPINLILLKAGEEFSGIDREKAVAHAGELLASLKSSHTKHRREAIEVELRQAEQAGDTDRIQALVKELISL